jgi:hypothetical protein
MSQDISTILKEATKDLLSEETLKAISTAVEQKAEEKTTLAVESALIQQDEEYSAKLEKVLEAIDADHTQKLTKIVTRIDEVHSKQFATALRKIDEDHSAKLEKLVKLYEGALKGGAEEFKKSVVDNVSSYLELYIDKAIPAQQIQEATQNTRNSKIVDQIKRLVSLDETFINESVKEALLDGKKQIDEAIAKSVESQKNAQLLNEKVQKLEANLLLEKKTTNLPSNKKSYVSRVLAEKDVKFINENFNYVLEMYDKREDENLQTLKESTKPKTQGTDVLREDTVETKRTSKSYSSAGDDGDAYVTESYVSLFKNKLV